MNDAHTPELSIDSVISAYKADSRPSIEKEDAERLVAIMKQHPEALAEDAVALVGILLTVLEEYAPGELVEAFEGLKTLQNLGPAESFQIRRMVFLIACANYARREAEGDA